MKEFDFDGALLELGECEMDLCEDCCGYTFYFPRQYGRVGLVQLDKSIIEKTVNASSATEMHVMKELPYEENERLFLCYEFVYDEGFPDGYLYYWMLVGWEGISFSCEFDTLGEAYCGLAHFIKEHPVRTRG